jgi:hypothetical protein
VVIDETGFLKQGKASCGGATRHIEIQLDQSNRLRAADSTVTCRVPAAQRPALNQ